MSGGYFGYNQYHLEDWAEDLQELIDNNGKALSEEEKKQVKRELGSDWFIRFPLDEFHNKYPKEVIKHFKRVVKKIKILKEEIDLIDYYLESDIGEEQFLKGMSELKSKR